MTNGIIYRARSRYARHASNATKKLATTVGIIVCILCHMFLRPVRNSSASGMTRSSRHDQCLLWSLETFVHSMKRPYRGSISHRLYTLRLQRAFVSVPRLSSSLSVSYHSATSAAPGLHHVHHYFQPARDSDLVYGILWSRPQHGPHPSSLLAS